MALFFIIAKPLGALLHINYLCWDMNESLIVTSALRHCACRGFCCCPVTKSYLMLWDSMDCSTLGFFVPHLLLLKFMSIESVMLSNHLVLCCPLLLLPWIFSSIRVFSNESALGIRGSKYWSFSFSNSPSNEYSRLISFRIDWFDLCAGQGTLRSVLQHHSSKSSILCCSAFFMAQLSYPYMLPGKTITLTIWTFICKVKVIFMLFYIS